MFFKHLMLSRWQQFESVRIDFHPRLTILTGANGSGKTTILGLLAKHSGWDQNYVATPYISKRSKLLSYPTRVFNGHDKSEMREIGEIVYSDLSKAVLNLPAYRITPGASGPGSQYPIELLNQQQVHCFYIPSHRQVFRYRQVESIQTRKKGRQEAFSEIGESHRNRFQGGGGEPSSFLMKNVLIAWVINGYGVRTSTSTVMPADDEQRRNFEGFQDALRKVLPPTLGFKELQVRGMEVVFVCNRGRDEFVLETASGGISTLIDVAWQIYMFSTNERADFTVIIDELENHLHPALQRRLLSSLLDAFPQARFIVSTHSPLIVGSVKDSFVYALRYNERSKVVAEKLTNEDKVKTVTEILDEVLGVPSSMPIWADMELKRILNMFLNRSLTENSFHDLRQQLKQVGLEHVLPNAISIVLDNQNDSAN